MSDDPAVLACTHVLTFGLLDQRRLFGVPDPRDLFAVETNWANDLSGLLYGLTGLGLLDNDPWEERQNNLPMRLLLYAAYRLAATTALCTLTGFSMGFFAAWAGMPLFVFFMVRLTGKKDLFGEDEPLVRPKQGISFWLMVLVAFLATSWAIFVEPPTHMSPHYTDQSCSARKDTSSPWPTTSVGVGPSDWWIAFIPSALAGYAVIYAQCLRGGKCNPKIRARMRSMFRLDEVRSNAMGVAIISQSLVILFLALGAGASGAAWFKAAIETPHLATVGAETADLVAKDCLVLAVGSIFVGGCIGALCTRWSVEKHEAIPFKLPYGIVVFGCCFFPFLLQYSLVIADEQAAPGRDAYMVTTLVAQAATGAFALVSMLAIVKQDDDKDDKDNEDDEDNEDNEDSVKVRASKPQSREEPDNPWGTSRPRKKEEPWWEKLDRDAQDLMARREREKEEERKMWAERAAALRNQMWRAQCAEQEQMLPLISIKPYR